MHFLLQRESQDEFPDTKNKSSGIGSKQKDSMPKIQYDFEKQRLEHAKKSNQLAANSLANIGRNEQTKQHRDRPSASQSKLPNVITNATEAHLGRMDIILHGAVLGPNTGRSFNTGEKR